MGPVPGVLGDLGGRPGDGLLEGGHGGPVLTAHGAAQLGAQRGGQIRLDLVRQHGDPDGPGGGQRGPLLDVQLPWPGYSVEDRLLLRERLGPAQERQGVTGVGGGGRVAAVGAEHAEEVQDRRHGVGVDGVGLLPGSPPVVDRGPFGGQRGQPLPYGGQLRLVLRRSGVAGGGLRLPEPGEHGVRPAPLGRQGGEAAVRGRHADRQLPFLLELADRGLQGVGGLRRPADVVGVVPLVEERVGTTDPEPHQRRRGHHHRERDERSPDTAPPPALHSRFDRCRRCGRCGWCGWCGWAAGLRCRLTSPTGFRRQGRGGVAVRNCDTGAFLSGVAHDAPIQPGRQVNMPAFTGELTARHAKNAKDTLRISRRAPEPRAVG